MASTEERVTTLISNHLGINDSSALDAELSDLGVNSMDAVNFLKTINEEFGANISPETASGFSSLRELVNHLDS